MPLVKRRCDHWEKKTGILVFGIFGIFVLFFPHLCGFIYLWSLRLMTFGWGFVLMLLLHFLFVNFSSNSQAALLQVCCSLLEAHSSPSLPGYHQQRLQNSKDCCLILPLEASSQRVTGLMPARALLPSQIPPPQSKVISHHPDILKDTSWCLVQLPSTKSFP